MLQRWRASVPNLVTYLGIAGALGVVGSLLLARRVKRQTLGLEPQEIARLVEHREAMLHGVKEGLVGLDPDGRVTLINDSACVLLDLPYDCVGSQPGRPARGRAAARRAHRAAPGHRPGRRWSATGCSR